MKRIHRLHQFCAIFAMGLISFVPPAYASTLDCQNLYVGRIWVEKGQGLYAVVFLNHPDDSSGSYWSFFVNWTPEERKSALAMLTTAKVLQHRVHVITEAANGCAIQDGGQHVKSVFLANNP